MQRRITQYRRHFLVRALFVSAALLLCVYVVQAQTHTGPTVKTLYVFPESVSSSVWQHVDALYTQEYDNNALYQDFKKEGSAYIEFEPVPPTEDVDTEHMPEETSIHSSEEVVDEVSGEAGPSTEPPFIDEAPVGEENIERGNDQQPDVPAEEPVSESAESVEPVDESASASLGSFAIAKDKLSLFVAEVIDQAGGVFGSEVVQEVVPATSVENTPVDAGAVAEEETDAHTEAEQVMVASESSENTESATSTETVDALATSTEASSTPSQKYFCEGEEGCGTYAVTFEDFDLPNLEPGESIQDAQLRLSLAAKMKNGSQMSQGLVVEYSLNGVWNNAGNISLADEVSNAINGGYFLYALPEITEVSILKGMEVRITYLGNPADIEGLYVDSAWIELGVVTLTEEELRARVLPDAFDELKKPEQHEFLGTEVDFPLEEMPHFVLKYHEQRNFIIRFFRGLFADKVADIKQVTMRHESAGEVPVHPEVHMTDDGLWTIQIPEEERAALIPGRYTFEIEVNEGSVTFVDTFEFQWGLLAINTHKSEYAVGETANLSFAALSQDGNTVCDAQLLAYIITPDGFVSRTPVTASGLCNGNNIVAVPDYASTYQTKSVGTHTLYVEWIDESGEIITHTEDTFEVASNTPISITRSAPTRIYPVSLYTVDLTVSATEAFTGSLVEQIPLAYEASNTVAVVSEEDGVRKLTWGAISLQAGESKTFSYTFDSPDISPFLYLLGPASVNVDGDIVAPSTAQEKIDTGEQDTSSDQSQESDTSATSTDSGQDTGVTASETTLVAPGVSAPATESNDAVLNSLGEEPVPAPVPAIPDVLPEPEPISFLEPTAQTLLQSAYSEDIVDDASDTQDVANTVSEKSIEETPTLASSSRSFTEKRKWQIASDATGSMLLYWATTTVPAGWTCVSCVPGDVFYQRFVMGSSTPGLNGGASTHTHSATGTVSTTGATGVSTVNGGGTDASTLAHTHTFAAPTISTDSNLPAYKELAIIQFNSAGSPQSLPAGAIALFDTSVPSGWTRYSAQDGLYIRATATTTAGTTGGANTHSHTISGNTSGPTGTTNAPGAAGTAVDTQAHTHAVNSATAGQNHEPRYIETVIGYLSATSSPTSDMIAMWTDTPPAAWTNLSTTSQPFANRFVKASTTYSATGGAVTHTHAQVTGIVSDPASGPVNRTAAGTGTAPGGHTHTVAVGGFSNGTNTPPYRTAIFAKRGLGGASPDAPTLHLLFDNEKTGTSTPVFEFTGADPDGSDTLVYQFQWDDDYDVGTSPVGDRTSDVETGCSPDCFSDVTNPGTVNPFPDTDRIRFTIQSALTSGTTYYWRVRVKETIGGTYGAWSTTTSFTYTSGISPSEWYQTEGTQFETGTLTNIATTTGGAQLSTTTASVPVVASWTSTSSPATANSLRLNKPSNVEIGDLLLIFVGNDDNTGTAQWDGNTLKPAGFTLINEVGDATSDAHSAAFYRIADGTEANSTTTSSQATANYWGSYVRVTGASTTNPLNVTGADYSVNNLASHPITSVTTTATNTLAFYLMSADGGDNYPFSVSGTGWGEVAEVQNNALAAGASGSWGTRSMTTPAATGAATVAMTLSDGAVGFQFAINPGYARGTVVSSEIDFDSVAGRTQWGEIVWGVTEPTNTDTKFRLYYSSTTACDTLVPNSALTGNDAGFDADQSGVIISSLSTSTYNRICLKMTLDLSTGSSTPSLNDWTARWVTTTRFTQSAYQWYTNTNAQTPTDPWPSGGTIDLLENEAMDIETGVLGSAAVRLRMSLYASNTAALASTVTFKLQFAQGDTCSASLTWLDVGDTGSTTAVWRGYDNAGVSDGVTLSSSVLASTTVNETYEEQNNTLANPNTISIGAYAEWDWALYNNGAADGVQYCFRMVDSSGSALSSYENYPILFTNYSPEAVTQYRPFDNEQVASTSPWFEFMANDPEGEDIDYQIQIDDNSDYSSATIDTDSITNLDDFYNTFTPEDKSPFSNAQRMRYIIPSALVDGTTYWWRVRSIDTAGSNSYGDWSTSQSFTIGTTTTISTWFQTTEAQFDTDTLVGTDATSSNAVGFATGSTTGTTTSSEIDFDDATIGNAWGTFSFTETGAANNILYHIEYYNGSTWTLIPNAALSGNIAGFDTSPVDLVDLDTSTYNLIRIRANFAAGSPTLRDWTITWGERVSVPTLVTTFDNEKFSTTSPTFTFYSTDPQSQDLEYEISWSTDRTFVTASTTRNSNSAPTGFSDVTNPGDVLSPYASGDTISYHVQVADVLTASTTYWWRVRAKDPGGGDSFSFWSDPWSFSVATTGESIVQSTWYQTTGHQFGEGTLESIATTTTNVTVGGGAGGGVAVQSWNSNTIIPGASLSLTKPSGVVSGDLLLILVGNDNTTNTAQWNNTTLKPSGFTLINTAGNATPDAHVAAFYRIADGTENSATTTTAQSAVNYWGYYIRVTGASTTNPINVTGVDYVINNLLSHPVTSITTTVNDTLAFYLLGGDGGDTYPFSVSGTGWSESSEIQAGTGAANAAGTWGTRSMATPAATGAATVAMNSNDGAAAFQFAINPGLATEGTLTSPSIDFDDGSGPAWGTFSWNDLEPGGSQIVYRIEYLNTSDVWTLIPDSALAGNAAGFSTTAVDLGLLDTATYNELRVVGDFTCGSSCPTLNDWTLSWSRGFTISGTAYEYDGISSTTSGTVAVAVNGTLQTGKTGSIAANGTWSIDYVTFFSGDIVTVFVSDGAATATDEAVGITQYDGTPGITGMRLQKRHLTIGSDDRAALSNSEIGLYDFSNNENVFYNVDGGNDLTMCADLGCVDASIRILPFNTYDPGTGADVTMHDFINYGTFTSGANTIRVSGSWDDNATTTLTSSVVIFTATSSTERIDETGATTTGFNTVTLGETSGTATWIASSTLDVNGNLSVTYGTFNRGTTSLTLAGNLTTGASGFWTGIGTTTFDGTNPGTWTDNNATKQNSGRIVVDGTAKTLFLGSNVLAESMTIGADDVFDTSVTGFDITIYRNWTNNNTFTARTGEVIFAATTTNAVIAQGSSNFYDLTFNGVGGSWSFSGASLTVGNDFSVSTGTVTMPTGTTTVTGAWNSTGGLFAHNNGGVAFNSAAAETITLAGSNFTNTFYNLAFAGSGSWSFVSANATTSNDLFISAGTVTFPSGALALGGSLIKSGGTIAANSGTLQLTSSSAETIQVGASSLASLRFSGSGAWSFVDTNVTAVGDMVMSNGTTTLPTGTLTLGGSFTNTAAFLHSSGTVLFNATATGKTISPGVSSFYNATFNSATGGWTVGADATTTNAFTLTNASSFTLSSGIYLSVSGAFTNSVGGASTTWTGSNLALKSNTAFAINSKTNNGDQYGTVILVGTTSPSMWFSSSTAYSLSASSSLYSQDHSGVDGDLYIFGAYLRTSGTEYWSYATDFDGTALGTSSARQANVRFASDASATFSASTLAIAGTSTASTTIASQSGTYTIAVSAGTTTASHYRFTNLGASGVTLATSTKVTALSDGYFEPSTNGGTGLTISSSTIDANPALQISRVEFATTTAIVANNVTQLIGTPSSYWWFRDSSGNLFGEIYDNDTGDPGSVRWDNSNLVITASGTVYADEGATPLGAPTCDNVTQNVKIVVDGGASYTGACDSSNGTYSIPGVVIAGDPVLTVFLDTNGGVRGTTITQTPTQNITNLNIYANRVITRHEDVAALTIADMALYDETQDTDIRFDAATGTTHSLTVRPDTELHVYASSTLAPGGPITLESGGSGNTYDGSFHIDNNATFTGVGTTTYTIGGRFSVDMGGTFTAASSSVVMTATTTNKTITTPSPQSLTFNNLSFTGPGGGWPITTNITVQGDLSVSAGTVSGTGNITVSNGSFSGNGTVALTGGTVLIGKTNTFGGTTPWALNNLTFGNGSIVGTTTPAGAATTTVSGVLTVATGHVLSAGASQWDLAGTSTPFVVTGTFNADTSAFRYSATSSANITSTTFYDLDLNASAGTPTYTGTGVGISVLNNLTIGGAAPTTVNLDTSDPAMNVDGSVTIRSNGTLVTSGSASFAVAKDWTNTGTLTPSGGTITFDSASAGVLSPGSSSFASVVVNKTGAFTIAQNATATAAFTLTAASAYTVNSGIALAVGGTFTNSLGGTATTWTGSTLSLYSGSNYQINASTTNDSYGVLNVAANTDIRMWNSVASSVTVSPSGSLYSQDHAGVDGALYIYGDYVKTSGSDYWSYATDFDGTALGGGSRAVTVSFASNATATYSGGALNIIGGAAASTTITNQGSGTYSMMVNGGTLNAQYYRVRNISASGLVLAGTPTVTSLSQGDFEVAQNGATALTVGGTVITQNPAKTFTGNSFATSSGISSAFNVTATGTTISSWRFTNHVGTIDGEFYNTDPGGDPGYIVWDDSAAQITISGNVYSDEGSTPIGGPTCDDSTPVVHLRVAGLTSYTAPCDSGTGYYSILGVAFSPGDSLVVYLDTAGGARAANVTVDPISSIGNMDLYQNRVIVRHEDTNPISIVDMASWDTTDDTDIPFTAVDGAPDTLSLPANTKLIIWDNKTFAPGGNVTLAGGGGGSAYDGTLELYGGAIFTAAGTEAHSIGGHLILGSGASITPAQSTFTFTTTGASRTVDTNNGSLYNVVFNGSGSWAFSDTALSVNDLTITTGAVTLPVGTTTVASSFVNTGGSFSHASGTLYFTSTASGKTVRPGTSSMYKTVFNGTGGAWSFVGADATTTADLTVSAGTVTFPSGTYMVGNAFNVVGGSFVHNSGTIKLTATTSSTTLNANGSDFSSLTIAGSGGYVMSETNMDILGTLRITQGALTMATGTVSIGGSLLNTGGTFAHASGTILFNSADTGETINPGSSVFNHVAFASASGGWTISAHATTTGNFSLTSASQFTLASSTTLYVSGVFTNTVGGSATTWHGSTIDVETGTNYTINTSSLGGDQYQTLVVGANTDLRMWNSAATTTTLASSSSLYSQDHAGTNGALYIYGDYARTSGSDYWSYATDFDGTALGGSSRAVTVSFAANATATYSGASLSAIGASTASTTITNQGSGTYALIVDGGTLNAQYYRVRNGNADGLQLSGLTTISNLSQGDFELATAGGSLITLSSTTLNTNASLAVTNMRFATTTAITGANVELVGSTASAWTFSSFEGNLSGEAYDIDGGDACGSLRWTDSSCLITEQTHYRWRNDNGGESVPDTEWYDVSWSKRKRVVLTNADATTYTNAVVEVPITYDSDMQSDFDDIRFTDSSGTTTIPYWIETYTGSATATAWVKVPSLTASDSTDVFFYYGNGGAADASTGSTTFSVFDDFEDGGITEYSGDTSLFSAGTTNVYERTYRLDASNVNGRTTDGIFNLSASTTVAQGQTIRYFQYIDTSGGSGDETCALFGVQSPGTANNNYAVCLELFGVDRVSVSKNVYDNDRNGTVLASSTITFATGWHEVEVDWGTNNTIAVAVSRNGAVVATTSVTDSSYTSGGIGFSFWFQHGGWDTYTSRPLLTTEPSVSYGVEQVSGGASWYAALDTAATGITQGTTQRLRFVVENSGLPITDQNFLLEYADKGVSPSCEGVTLGSYVPVPVQASCGTSAVCMKSSTYYTNQASTTDQITGDGVFTYGQIVEDPSNKTGNISLDANYYTEVEYALEATTYASNSNYCFRVSNDGTDLDSYARVAELRLQFDPTVSSWSFNNGEDIVVTPGATTTIYATGTVSDANGYADLLYATSTFYRSSMGPNCTADNNNCYQIPSPSCAMSNCSGNSCDLTCSADIYFFADPTDTGAYSAQDWRADLLIADSGGGHDTQSTFGSELTTMRALEVNSSIAYGSLAVSENTGANDATTTIQNIGNDAIDISLSGTDLSDGASSVIPATTQKYATSTFTYSSCTFCSTLTNSSVGYEVDLSKPTTTTPVLSDDVFWGIAIPFGASATAHSGVNTFMATAD